jgi:hypothetical protein
MIVFCLACGDAYSAVLQVSSGELTGALGVNVDGTLYDVQFVETSCPALYSGCDELSDFTFQSAAAAGLASRALILEVFLDGPDGDFDTVPSLTFGCESATRCLVFTTYAPPRPEDGFAPTAVAENTAGLDVSFPNSAISLFLNTSNSPEFVMARWTLTNGVVEPGSLALLSLGLLALTWRSRKKY